MTVKAAPKPHMPPPTTPITGDELYAMGDIGRTELVRGEIIYMSPVGHPHGYIKFNIGAILHTFVKEHGLGRVMGGEVGIYTQRNPDTVRGADVAFISNERFAQVQSRSFLDVAPKLVVEVLSPDDSWSDITEKLEEYFNINVEVVWIVDPRREQVHVYRSQTEVDRLTVDDKLSGGNLLPGFEVPIAELFGTD